MSEPRRIPRGDGKGGNAVTPSPYIVIDLDGARLNMTALNTLEQAERFAAQWVKTRPFETIQIIKGF